MQYNSFCKIFIDTNLKYEDIFNRILIFINGRREVIDYILADWCEICVKYNDEYSLEKYLEDKKDFIYWKYYLDVETTLIEEQASAEYINNIRKLISFLKEFCNDVVPACDFENEL